METVKFEGKTYTLTQDAYIEDGRKRHFISSLSLDDDRPFYMASAVDQEGNEHEVYWEVKENWYEIEDEQERCDWDNPEYVEKI